MNIKQNARRFDLEEIKLPKIHGHASIILKDVKTGMVERVEHDNVFQSAFVSKWFANLGDNNWKPYNNSAFISAPWKAMVGGILLFRDSITAGSQFMPAGNRMVGKGSTDIVNTGTPAELGSFNAAESSASASAITQVYDFTTSQANGDISCVCLTSHEGGIVGYGNASGQRYTGTMYDLGRYGKETDFVEDGNDFGTLAENGMRYFFGFDNNGKIVVTETKTCGLPNHGTIFASQKNTYLFDQSDYNAKYTRGAGDGMYWFYTDTNKFTLFTSDYGNVNPGETFYYLEFDCTNHTLTQKTLVNSYTYMITISGGYNPGMKSYFTKNNKFMTRAYEGNDIFYPVLFDTSTGSVIYSGSGILNYEDTRGTVTISNNLIIHGNYIIDLVNGTTLPIDTNGLTYLGGGAYSRGCPSIDFVDGYHQVAGGNQAQWRGKLIAYPQYLATINNLDSPVTKTAARTMKVIYTLEEV